MKNFRIKKLSIAALVLGFSLTFTSCVDDLKREPITDVTSASLYKDFNNYNNLLAKLYGGLAVGGQEGGDGKGDIFKKQIIAKRFGQIFYLHIIGHTNVFFYKDKDIF